MLPGETLAKPSASSIIESAGLSLGAATHLSGSPAVTVKMVFKRYVEIGRVALINYGEDYGKLVDVLDQNWALVDAPDMFRGKLNFKRLSLTDIKIDIKRAPKKKELLAAMEAADVKNKWENSSWGRKLIVQNRRAALTDFERFKLMLAKIKKAGVFRQELAKLKKDVSASEFVLVFQTLYQKLI